jgi:hypothetical protein
VKNRAHSFPLHSKLDTPGERSEPGVTKRAVHEPWKGARKETHVFDKDEIPAQRNDKSNLLPTRRLSEQLHLMGGEPLEGSGFEDELPEPDSEWRDPR